MQWGLSQAELAHLLGIDETALCKVETQARRPSLTLMLGVEVVFGHPAKEIFPKEYEKVEDDIMARAKALYAELETSTDDTAREKLRLLTEMIDRSDPIPQ